MSSAYSGAVTTFSRYRETFIYFYGYRYIDTNETIQPQGQEGVVILIGSKKQREAETTKVVIEQAGVEIPARCRKDEQPTPGSRAWKEVPIIFEGNEILGKIAENGHWIYFADGDQWFKLNATSLVLTELLVIRKTVRAVMSDDEKKEKKKLRREARKAKRALLKTEDPGVAAINAQEEKDKLRAMKRKARKIVEAPSEE